jgi:glutamine phosphoribosylpyrophosphate amidotransferase
MKTEFMFEATANAMKMLKGAYSCLLLVMGVGTVGFRDPYGIRPLMLGSRAGLDGKTEWCIASEDCAFGPIGFTRVRDVNPGEIVIVTPAGELLSRQVSAYFNGCPNQEIGGIFLLIVQKIESCSYFGEDCAFGPIGFTSVRDINLSEIVIIPSCELLSRQVSQCCFQWRYNANVVNRIATVD